VGVFNLQGDDQMNNLQRLVLETKGIQLLQDELTVYLQYFNNTNFGVRPSVW
jgi:hypothetical protein